MYRGTQTTDAPLVIQHQGRERRFASLKSRFDRHRHRLCLDRVRNREERVLLAKIYHVKSASDVLSEI